MSECFGQSTNEHVSERINENHPVTIQGSSLWQAFQAKVESKAEAALQAT
jgi:hypothetical protein